MTTIVNDVSDVGIYNIVADQGTTFMRTITYKNSAGIVINLGTGASARMKVRKTYPARLNVAASVASPVLDLGTSGSGATITAITVTPATGIIDIKIPSTNTAAVPAGIYDYDLEVTLGTSPGVGASGDVIKVIRGLFEVRQEITY